MTLEERVDAFGDMVVLPDFYGNSKKGWQYGAYGERGVYAVHFTRPTFSAIAWQQIKDAAKACGLSIDTPFITPCTLEGSDDMCLLYRVVARDNEGENE